MELAGFYKSSIYLEQHKFQYIDQKTKESIQGFFLNESQLRALNALTKLLYQAENSGTAHYEPNNLEGWEHISDNPVLLISRNQYLTAYFGGRLGSGGKRPSSKNSNGCPKLFCRNRT
jgi:hypothetical protein